uniref:DUF2851 family protein n=1 Tax=Flavobacterium sp. TaxID=239 RepID=UPI0040495A16
MKEVFLHHVWQYQKLNSKTLTTHCQKSIIVLNPGIVQTQSGPDFFNAQLIIDGQKWAGNIEIHIKSSDWYAHQHQEDERYDSVILHVVWEHDVDIFREDESVIPVLELQNIVDSNLLLSYNNLMQPKSWLFCEKDIHKIPAFTLDAWQERLFFERLESKSKQIEQLIIALKSDWEAILFVLLAKNFGSNTNGNLFMQMALSFDFSLVRKEMQNPQLLEALFFGRMNLLDDDFQENYPNALKKEWEYQKVKYHLTDSYLQKPQFFKVRPDNFPTIRIAQLANLYVEKKQLFQEILAMDDMDKIYKIFNVQTSEYWKNHYRFDLISTPKIKKISKSFIQNIYINTILPIKFAFYKSTNSWGKMDSLVTMMQSLDAEKNTFMQKFSEFGIKPVNAFQTQALLNLKQNYCDLQKCLNCAIGNSLLSEKI